MCKRPTPSQPLQAQSASSSPPFLLPDDLLTSLDTANGVLAQDVMELFPGLDIPFPVGAAGNLNGMDPILAAAKTASPLSDAWLPVAPNPILDQLLDHQNQQLASSTDSCTFQPIPNGDATSQSITTQSNEKPATTATTTEEYIPAGMSKAEWKRLKNTEAARQSRRRKNEQMRGMESRVEELEMANKLLEQENSLLKTQNYGYSERIKALEKQVEDFYTLLLAFGAKFTKREREEAAQMIHRGNDDAASTEYTLPEKRIKFEV